MKRFKHIIFILTVCTLGISDLQARIPTDSLQHRAVHRVEVEIHPTYVVPTHKFMKGNNPEGKNIRSALSGHLKYAFQFAEGSYFNRLFPHAYQGIGFGVNDFLNTGDFGSPLAAYIYQGSQIARLNSRLTFNYEWNFGVSFGWKEYNRKTYEQNHVIGTDLDVYMDLAFLLKWQLSPHYYLTTGIGLTHCSNGNTHYPNQGINLLEGKIGITRTFGKGNDEERLSRQTHATLRLPRYLSYDLVLYGGFRVRELYYKESKYLPSKSFGVCGINFNPMYHFNNSLSAGASLDLQYDASSNLGAHVTGVGSHGIEYERQPFHERLSAGISIRGEWAMPIFSINGGIGYNVYAKSFDTKKFYQVLAMKIFLHKKMFIHIGYQMNRFKEPNNLMLGGGYRFH